MANNKIVTKGKKKKDSKENKVKKLIRKNKNIIIGLCLLIMDIILIIYVASSNAVNYVNVNGEEIFVGKTRNLLLGRNYITLVVSAFIFLYGLLINKVIVRKKINIKKMILIFGGILLFNMILFCIFTNRVY